MATSVIRIKKICAWCGKEFEAQKLSTQFCSHRCSSLAYKDKKRQEKKQRAETASQRSHQKKKVEDIKDKEYLTVSEAAQLLGFTRDSVYKLIYRGLLKAHRITSHWTVIYRKDIDEMITARPIDPSGISKKDREPITEFYTTKEVLEYSPSATHGFSKSPSSRTFPKSHSTVRPTGARNTATSYSAKRIHMLTKSPNGILSPRYRKNTV